ncbi:MAG: hypothetical protein ACLP3C_17315 [Mycobacterium sp.]|uniref:hypothetical protein n=1 Tax=Mycobacterium sp. TaxID=1785 RepID=UPI003F958F56
MTDDELIGVFKYGLRKLDVNDNGLTDANQIADLNVMAALCRAVKTSIAAATHTTVEHLLLHRLACLTEDLLVTPWITNPTAARDWMLARSELLQAQIPGA